MEYKGFIPIAFTKKKKNNKKNNGFPIWRKETTKTPQQNILFSSLPITPLLEQKNQKERYIMS